MSFGDDKCGDGHDDLWEFRHKFLSSHHSKGRDAHQILIEYLYRIMRGRELTRDDLRLILQNELFVGSYRIDELIESIIKCTGVKMKEPLEEDEL